MGIGKRGAPKTAYRGMSRRQKAAYYLAAFITFFSMAVIFLCFVAAWKI
ncbi:hypothetical protein SAMN06298226_1807 [Nitrosovibrio sp. Nv4]|nr:hypothetical protein SAMN06298226_1807 [Nitrosovibrio sp. Nv4]